LHHRNEARKLFHRQTSPAAVFLEPIAQRCISQKLIDRTADQMCRCFVAGEQQQKHHRYHLVATNLLTFLFNPHHLVNKTSPTIFSRGFKLLFQIPPHRQNIGDQTQKADKASQARKTAVPEPQHEQTLIDAAKLGVEFLQRAQAGAQIDYVNRAVDGLFSRMHNEIEDKIVAKVDPNRKDSIQAIESREER
jgi:hypothetical protein